MRLLLPAGLLFLVVGCKKDPAEQPSGGAAPTVRVEVEYHLMDNGQPFAPGALVVDGQGRSVRIDRLRFLSSGFTLLAGPNDTLGRFAGVAVLANGAAPSGPISLGNIGPGQVQALHFDLGLDSVTNHSIWPNMDPVPPAPLDDPTLSWGWHTAFGYKFIEVEGRFDSNGDGVVDYTDAGFTVHAAGDALRTHKEFMLDRSVGAGSVLQLQVQVEVHGLLQGVMLAVEGHDALQGTTPTTLGVMQRLANGTTLVP